MTIDRDVAIVYFIKARGEIISFDHKAYDVQIECSIGHFLYLRLTLIPLRRPLKGRLGNYKAAAFRF